MKVAIYARYSSENQREASIEDQFRICREFARKQGWTIAGEYSDHAISGATLTGLLGYSVAAAGDVNGDGRSDVVIGEPGATRAHIYLGSSTVSLFLHRIYQGAAASHFGR